MKAYFMILAVVLIIPAGFVSAQTTAQGPDDPGAAIFEKGVDRMTAKLFDQAIASFRAYSRIEPDDPAAYLNIGLAYYGQKKYDLALKEIKTALKMKPDYAKAWRFLGSAYFNLKRYPDAVEAYTKAVNAQKDYAEAWVWLGTTYDSMNQFTDAVAAYKQAIAIEPDNGAGWFGIGGSRYLLGDYAGTIAAINRWKDLEHAPDATRKRSAELYLGHSHAHIGQYELAVAAFMRVLAVDPNNVRAILGLGEVYIAMNKPAMVAQQKAKLDRLDPIFSAKLQQKMAAAGIK